MLSFSIYNCFPKSEENNSAAKTAFFLDSQQPAKAVK